MTLRPVRPVCVAALAGMLLCACAEDARRAPPPPGPYGGAPLTAYVGDNPGPFPGGYWGPQGRFYVYGLSNRLEGPGTGRR